MSGIFQDNNSDISRDELHLFGQLVAERFVAANRQHRHRQFCLRELSEIFGQLWPRNKVGPAGMHASGSRISFGVRFAIRFRDRMNFVRSENVPEIFKVSSLALRSLIFRDTRR